MVLRSERRLLLPLQPTGGCVRNPREVLAIRRSLQSLTGRSPLAAGLILCLFAGLSNGVAADTSDTEHDRLRCLKGIDVHGKQHQFAETEKCKATVVVFLATRCPISNGTLPTMGRVATRFKPRGIEFYGVVSDPVVTREAAAKHHTEFHIPFPVLFDASGSLKKCLQPTHTPQAIVLSPTGDVLYTGRIDDRFASLGRKREGDVRVDLEEALADIVAGRNVAVPETKPIGCLLEESPAAVDGDVTYSRDIAPLIQSNCANCHRPGEAGPFPLLTYADVSAHAHQIAEVTKLRLMPPWHAHDNFGHFRDERRLSNSEIALIRRWVDTGKPEGSPQDKPETTHFTSGWQLGRPDLILKMSEAFPIGPDGPDVHQHFVLPTGLRQNKLVAAIEFRPGNPNVVHHASFYIDISGAARHLDQQQPDYGYGSFSGPGFENFNALRSWLPGMAPRKLPKGMGSLLPARSDIVMEIHYQRTGKPETDQSSVGVYFADSSAKQVVMELQVMNKDLHIPAGVARHRHEASFTLSVDCTLLDAAPHMHLLGREMKATATRPDGEIVPLIWIDDWDFRWQAQYIYVDPVRLPKGTRIDVTTIYDNSTGNPLNPHSPPQPVEWGEEATAEMAICHFRYICDTPQDLMAMGRDYRAYLDRNQAAYRARYEQSRQRAQSAARGR